MDGLANGADTMLCANCGHEIRRGMLRCRECGHSIVETGDTPDAGDEFVLTGAELLPSNDPKCPLCGAFLEPGTTDCAACTSALLDQLLNGPGADDAPAFEPLPELNMAPTRPVRTAPKLHVRRAVHQGSRGGAASDGGHASTNPAAGPARARPADPARAKAKGGAAAQPRGKQVRQFATPADIDALNQEAVNRHAASQQAAASEQVAASEEEAEAGGSTTVETNAACMALIASLATADAQLRCGIATALGKLGDKEALVHLERHLTDQDIRVRRAVAAALVQLGHPKGETLLDIAERKPAAEVIKAQRAAAAPPKPRRSSGGGGGIDSGTLKIVGGAVVGVAVVAGGIWYWMNSAPSSGRGKSKSAAAKKAGAKKTKTAPKPPPPVGNNPDT